MTRLPFLTPYDHPPEVEALEESPPEEVVTSLFEGDIDRSELDDETDTLAETASSSLLSIERLDYEMTRIYQRQCRLQSLSRVVFFLAIGAFAVDGWWMLQTATVTPTPLSAAPLLVATTLGAISNWYTLWVADRLKDQYQRRSELCTAAETLKQSPYPLSDEFKTTVEQTVKRDTSDITDAATQIEEVDALVRQTKRTLFGYCVAASAFLVYLLWLNNWLF